MKLLSYRLSSAAVATALATVFFLPVSSTFVAITDKRLETAPVENPPVAPQAEEHSEQARAIAQNTAPEVKRENPAEEVPPATTEQNNAAPAELPRAAGELPLLALIGLVVVGLRYGLSHD